MEDPGRSRIRIVSAEEYSELGTSGVQEILRSQHILVTGLPRSGLAFDERGLASIGRPKKAATIHGKFFLILPIRSP